MRFVKGYRGADGSIQNQIGRYGQVGRFTGHGGAQLRGYPDYVIGGFHDDPRDEPGIDRLPPEYRGEPIIFSANTSVQSSTSGQAINTDALRNNLNRVVEIHEIKFACIAKEGTIAGGGIIGVKLTYKEDEGVQPHPITRDFMPLSLLSGNDYTENPASFESNIVFPTPAGYAGYSIYKLSLRYPIRLPPGALIEPLFSHLGQTPNAITVYVSYAGRVLPRGEDVKGPIYLPYFTQFATTIYLGVQSTATSSEKDLVNPIDHNGPLMVDRMVGRLNAQLFNNAANPTPIATEQFESVVNSQGTAFSSLNVSVSSSTDLIRVGMYSSDGYPIIAPLTPFRNVFDLWTRELPIEFILDPGDNLIATVDSLVPDNAVAADNIAIQVGIGLRGYREV